MPPSPPATTFNATQITNALTALGVPAQTQRALLQMFPGDTSTTTVNLESIVVAFPQDGSTVIQVNYREVHGDGTTVTYSKMFKV
jgi:hypothetical protein